jgi:hypothetical protein
MMLKYNGRRPLEEKKQKILSLVIRDLVDGQHILHALKYWQRKIKHQKSFLNKNSINSLRRSMYL